MPSDNSKAWIRLDLQDAAVIYKVRLEFDNTNLGDAGKIVLWDTLKHYEIQIGNDNRLDANPVYAQYQAGDETKMQREDCAAVLASVDPELLTWLKFDDPTFIGKDSSNYKTDAQIMIEEFVPDGQHPAYMDLPVVWKVPVLLVSSVYGPPLWGSLVLAYSYYLKMGASTLPPASNFAISFWFMGMPHPSAQQKHVLLEMSIDNGASFVRFKQNGHNPTRVTTFLTIDGQAALRATSRSVFADSITSVTSAVVIVGRWNHSLLNVLSDDKSAEICLNGQCFAMQNPKHATDGCIGCGSKCTRVVVSHQWRSEFILPTCAFGCLFVL